MLRPHRLHVKDINPILLCGLCKGYLIDATTIIECLHSFCRSCIVKYLESNKYCPICDVQVHKTKPLLNIRADQTLQDIVYKLVPGLFQNEMRRRREWFTRDGGNLLGPRPCEEGPMYLSLQYDGDKNETDRRRFLRCPSAVSVHHLHKLLRAKYGLAQQHRVEVMYAGEPLRPDLTLADIAYIYLWRTKSPLHLTYRIFEAMRSAAKKDATISESTQQSVTETWKEVQLQISENGIMCVTNIEDALSPAVDQLNNNITQSDEKQIEKPAEKPPDKPTEPEKTEEIIKKEDTDKKKEESVEHTEEKVEEKVEIVETAPEKENKVEEKPETSSKREAPEVETPSPAKQPRIDKEKPDKPNLKNVQQLSSNHPLKIHSQQVSRAPPQPILPPPNLQYSRVSIVPRRNIPPPYKTLRDPPRAWNPQLPPRPAPHGPQTTPTTPQTQQKPAKFFKARNNVPRYLGNPASGVKPMYQVPKTPPPGEGVKVGEGRRPEIGEGTKSGAGLKLGEGVKPKLGEGLKTTVGLRLVEGETKRAELGEGRPSTPRPQLKINQSTVPILNPLRDKTKTDRRPPNGKKEKPQISFTPPNPFVPQLGSPSLPPPNHWAGGPPPVYFPPPGLFYQQRYAIQGPPRSPRPAPPPPASATATSPDPKLAAA